MRSKKFITAAIATLACTLYSTLIFAASGLNAQEQAILDQLEAGFTIGETAFTIPAEYINQAETEFMRNGVDVTVDQAAVISANIIEAINVMKEAGTGDPRALSSADQQEILDSVQDAAAAIGYKVSIDTAAKTVTVVNVKGSTAFSSKEVINQTGHDMNVTVAVIAVIAAVAVSVTVISKKKLFVARRTHK